MYFPIFTERLSLAPMGMSELKTFVSYRQDPAIARFQSWEVSFSIDNAIDLIESQATFISPEKGEWLQLAIFTLAEEEHVGDVAFKLVEDIDSTFELGFTISQRHQRRGFAKEAASGVMTHLVSESQARKFFATTDSRNIASIRLLSALGFTQNDSKGWQEDFKNEIVNVCFFEKSM